MPGVPWPGESTSAARITSSDAIAQHETIARWAAELREMASAPADLDTAALNELFLALVGFRDLLDAHTAPVAVAWKDRGDWEADGSKSPNHALARDTGTSPEACSALFRRARKTTTGMPGTQNAWASGAMSTETVDLLARAASGKRADLFAEDESQLLAKVDGKLHCDIAKEVRYWRDQADAKVNPDGTPPGRARHLHVSPTFDGAVAIDGILDPVGGAIVHKALADIEAEFKLADKKAAEAATREDGTREQRTSTERRADALVELALRATKAPEGSKRPTVALHVAVGSDKLAGLCETFAGIVIKPSDLADYLSDATVQFIRFQPDGQPDAATRTTGFKRFFTGALRTAIQLRDRRCQHTAGCDAPIEQCDVDHRQPFSTNGRTDAANARLECIPHNRIATLQDPDHPPPRST